MKYILFSLTSPCPAVFAVLVQGRQGAADVPAVVK